jgi:hypothetical protein
MLPHMLAYLRASLSFHRQHFLVLLRVNHHMALQRCLSRASFPRVLGLENLIQLFEGPAFCLDEAAAS